MIRKIVKKTILSILCLLGLCNLTLSALDYNDFYDSVTHALTGLIDPNEGLTVFRSLYIPFGGRSEAMGSAFTAMSDDIAFLNYNPAVSSVLPNTEFAVFHNFWIADSAMDTIAFSQRTGNLGYGVALKSFYVPFTEYNIFGERVSVGYYSETIGTLNLSHNFLAGYTFKGLAVGVNLKVGFRGVPNYSDNLTDQIIIDSGLSQSAVAIMGDVGMLLRFNFGKLYSSRDPNFNIGLAVHNLGASFVGLGTKITLDDALPSYASIGLSYKIIRPLTLAVEFQQPFNVLDINKSEKFAVSMGTEIQITDFFAMQAGFLLRGANPKISLGSTLEWKKLIFNVTYSLDLTSSLNPINRVSLSAKIDLGDKGRGLRQETAYILYAEGLNLYVNGQFNESITVWEKALELFPRFDPAIQGIIAAENSLELRTQIRDIQQLN